MSTPFGLKRRTTAHRPRRFTSSQILRLGIFGFLVLAVAKRVQAADVVVLTDEFEDRNSGIWSEFGYGNYGYCFDPISLCDNTYGQYPASIKFYGTGAFGLYGKSAWYMQPFTFPKNATLRFFANRGCTSNDRSLLVEYSADDEDSWVPVCNVQPPYGELNMFTCQLPFNGPTKAIVRLRSSGSYGWIFGDRLSMEVIKQAPPPSPPPLRPAPPRGNVVLLREDFDDTSSLNPSIWSPPSAGELVLVFASDLLCSVGKGKTFFYGEGALALPRSSILSLQPRVYPAMATMVLFATRNCDPDINNAYFNVDYSINGGASWRVVSQLYPPYQIYRRLKVQLPFTAPTNALVRFRTPAAFGWIVIDKLAVEVLAQAPSQSG